MMILGSSRGRPAQTLINFAEIRVLMAEDEPFSRKLQLQALGELGMNQFIIAQNGREAIEQLQSPLVFDLIISDWNMPEATGMEVLRAARRLRPRATFVMLTARTDAEAVHAALAARVDGYVAKPFSVPQLRLRLITAFRNAEKRNGNG